MKTRVIFLMLLLWPCASFSQQTTDRIWSIVSLLKVDSSFTGNVAPRTFSPAENPLSAPTNNPDVRVRPTTNTTQSEMSIAVSPLSNNTVLASANATDYPVTAVYGTGAYWSTNGGSTWQGFDQPPSGNSNRGDPAAAIDRNGHFYVGSIAPNSGQGVMRSTNGGVTWSYYQVSNPNGALLDKNHLTVDNNTSSSYQGNLYSAWTDFGQSAYPIEFARSTDHGVTWVNTQNISSNSWGQGVNLQTGPTGILYATWANPPVKFSFYRAITWF
jgi:hypothetical protein